MRIASPERLRAALMRQLRPGAIVDGRFVIQGNPNDEAGMGLLDEGGMGSIFRAWERDLECDCVLKVLAPHMHPRFRPDLDCVEMHRIEAKTMVQLVRTDSSAFVHVYGRGDVRVSLDDDMGGGSIDLPYLAMEVLHGVTFQKIIARTRRANASLSWYFLLTLAHKMASALAVAHSQNVVHRDIKPDNLYFHTLPHRWEVKLIDFGIARIRGQRRRGGTGTDRYAAPELVRGGETDPADDGTEDTQSDIYPLGLVMYELATGRGPFDRPKGGFASAHVFERPPLLSTFRADAPSAFVDLVNAALAKNPKNRPTAAQIVGGLHEILCKMPEEGADAEIRAFLPRSRKPEPRSATTHPLPSAAVSPDQEPSHEHSAVSSLRSEAFAPQRSGSSPSRILPMVPTLPLPVAGSQNAPPIKYADTEPDREPFGASDAPVTAPLAAAPASSQSAQPRVFNSMGEMFELWDDDDRYMSSPLAAESDEPRRDNPTDDGTEMPLTPPVLAEATTDEPVVRALARQPAPAPYRRVAFAVLGVAVGILASALVVRIRGAEHRSTPVYAAPPTLAQPPPATSGSPSAGPERSVPPADAAPSIGISKTNVHVAPATAGPTQEAPRPPERKQSQRNTAAPSRSTPLPASSGTARPENIDDLNVDFAN